MEIKLSLYKVRVKYYSSTSLLNKFKEYKIVVYDFKILDDYFYEVKLTKKDFHKIKDDFKEIEIIKKQGIIPFFEKQIFKRATILASILSIALFIFCSKILMNIKVNGISKEVSEEILTYLNENDIKLYRKMPSIKKISAVKDSYFLNNLNKIENIDMTVNGNVIYVNYTLKKKVIELEKKHGKMYAKKDALIDKIAISCGNVLVKEYEYVKRGQLIVDEYFYNNEVPLYVGTRGQIYAYTYENVYVSTYYKGNKDDVYMYLLDEARREVSLNFQDEEHIESEIINAYYKNQDYVYLNVSYKLYENIVVF